jgi:hypothetical protein
MNARSYLATRKDRMSSSERRTFCRDYAKSSLDGAGIKCNVTDRSQVMDNADGSSWVETWVYVPKQEPPKTTNDLTRTYQTAARLAEAPPPDCGCLGCESARPTGDDDGFVSIAGIAPDFTDGKDSSEWLKERWDGNGDTPPEEEGDYAPKHFHLRQPELKRDIFGAVIMGTDKVEHLYCFDDCEYPHLPAYEPDCLFRG